MLQSNEKHPNDVRQPSRLLVVEGANDKAVIEQIVRRYESLPLFTVQCRGGYGKLHASLRRDILEDNREVIGVVVDADQNLESRWQSIKDRIERIEEIDVELDDFPSPDGTIVLAKYRSRGVRVGVWLMPDNVNSGELEDFVADMIPDNDPVWPRSQCYIDGIPHDQRKFKGKVQRAKVYAWLATREKPGFMGQAIDRKDLDVNGILCQRFVAWLTELFG